MYIYEHGLMATLAEGLLHSSRILTKQDKMEFPPECFAMIISSPSTGNKHHIWWLRKQYALYRTTPHPSCPLSLPSLPYYAFNKHHNKIVPSLLPLSPSLPSHLTVLSLPPPYHPLPPFPLPPTLPPPSHAVYTLQGSAWLTL